MGAARVHGHGGDGRQDRRGAPPAHRPPPLAGSRSACGAAPSARSCVARCGGGLGLRREGARRQGGRAQRRSHPLDDPSLGPHHSAAASGASPRRASHQPLRCVGPRQVAYPGPQKQKQFTARACHTWRPCAWLLQSCAAHAADVKPVQGLQRDLGARGHLARETICGSPLLQLGAASALPFSSWGMHPPSELRRGPDATKLKAQDLSGNGHEKPSLRHGRCNIKFEHKTTV